MASSEQLTIRDKMRRIRVSGMTIDDVALALGASTRSVRRWALGQCSPTKKFANRLESLYQKRLKFYRQG